VRLQAVLSIDGLDLRHPYSSAEREDRRALGRSGRAGSFRLRTYAMRRTKATLIYKRTKNLGAVQRLPDHSKLEDSTLP